MSSCGTYYTITPVGESVECKNTDCLRNILGPPNEITDNDNAGKIWMYYHLKRSDLSYNSININVNVNSDQNNKIGKDDYVYYTKFWIKDDLIVRSETNRKKKKFKWGKAIGTYFLVMIPAGIILTEIVTVE